MQDVLGSSLSVPLPYSSAWSQKERPGSLRDVPWMLDTCPWPLEEQGKWLARIDGLEVIGGFRGSSKKMKVGFLNNVSKICEENLEHAISNSETIPSCIIIHDNLDPIAISDAINVQNFEKVTNVNIQMEVSEGAKYALTLEDGEIASGDLCAIPASSLNNRVMTVTDNWEEDGKFMEDDYPNVCKSPSKTADIFYSADRPGRCPNRPGRYVQKITWSKSGQILEQNSTDRPRTIQIVLDDPGADF
ncbi:hypothetical protein MA16_Dca005459 [Dendrobium catenatum]|uniref:Uncharacterized protein n=1 Tax=Dendrobium catenatum TaxID=906689 RepID=A0A2I0X3G1_9ASPA|nr:hypothetical protein MA16_Dca005459 [Dendrobium catenatum]